MRCIQEKIQNSETNVNSEFREFFFLELHNLNSELWGGKVKTARFKQNYEGKSQIERFKPRNHGEKSEI